MLTIRGKWTDEEIQFLKFAYPNKDFTSKEISSALNRNISAIRNKAFKLNIKRYKENLGEGLKRCSKCNTVFPIELFPKNGKNRVHSQCKECKNSQRRKEMNVVKEMNAVKEMNVVKKCSKCKEIKDISMFWKNRSNNDGYHWHCKECAKVLKDESNLRLLKKRGW